jgi:hypothetical protein
MELPPAISERLAPAFMATPKLNKLAARYQYGLNRYQVCELDQYQLTAHLVRRARALGSADGAITELLELATQDQSFTEIVAVLAGVVIDEPINLAPGVRLIPYGPNQLPDFVRRIEGAGYRLMDRRFADVRYAAALVKRFSFGPVFGEERQPSGEFPRDTVADFTALAMCLTLATSKAVGIVRMYWGDADPRLPISTEPIVFQDPQWEEGAVDGPGELDVPELLRTFSKYSRFKERDPKGCEHLDLIIKRLNRSRRAWRDEERAIELGIALEALLMKGDSTANQEIRFKVGLRAAWLAGNAVDERADIFTKVRKLYDLRSKAAHSGQLATVDDPLEREIQLSEGTELVARLVKTILDRGRWPEWNHLVLGGHHDTSQ